MSDMTLDDILHPRPSPRACCSGSGRVPSAVGDMRPCSRCGENKAFDEWYARLNAAERALSQGGE